MARSTELCRPKNGPTVLSGVMFLWFLLTAISLVFVAADIRSTPESGVLKWGFTLVTAYTGPVGAFLYVLGCREPLQGLHERYTAIRWRQVLGSTMHCVAGDGIGILAGAAIASYFTLSSPVDLLLEYSLGFGFGWTIFQALFMRDTSGGSYKRALAKTFLPELLSMNVLMAGMLPVAAVGRMTGRNGMNPLKPEFWFVMSMALLAGFLVAYPMNWWLVARGLKHGMMTVRPSASGRAPTELMQPSAPPAHASHDERPMGRATVSRAELIGVSVLSVAALALGIVAATFAPGM